jgi:hypothetical protein
MAIQLRAAERLRLARGLKRRQEQAAGREMRYATMHAGESCSEETQLPAEAVKDTKKKGGLQLRGQRETERQRRTRGR